MLNFDVTKLYRLNNAPSSLDSLQLNRKYRNRRCNNWNWNENMRHNIASTNSSTTLTTSTTSIGNESLLLSLNSVHGDKDPKTECIDDDSEDEDSDIEYLVQSIITVDKYRYPYPNATNLNTTNNKNICNHKLNDKHTNCNKIQNICNDRWKPLYAHL